MRINDLQKKIVKAIRTSLSHRDLCNLCAFNDLSVTGLKRSVQDRLEAFVQNQSYNQLLLINNKIEEYDRSSASSKRGGGATSGNATSNAAAVDTTSSSNYKSDTLSDALISAAPINLQDEIAVINRNEIVVLHFTNYAQPQTAVPTQTVTGINERAHNIRLPNMLPHVPIQSSPFYCCVVCLHPLALLIPQQMPNINQSNRIMSHNTIQFSLSENAQKLIAKNVQSYGNKIDYKWQVLLRFVNIDPTITLPTPDESVAQMIPPYLSVSVNGENISLWDILPSNCRTKEGKRHPKPINITDKLNVTSHTKNCYRQNVTVSWWQTPGVFQYYYVGVYLERKLSVKEILDLFASNRHVNILPVEATLTLIKTKLNDARYANEGDDDDLFVSSVLPINLSCPVGRSRIQIPLRTLNCQHLQCFDAHLFLSMNERRSIWKCPICDMSATPNELFCDRYFKQILKEFRDNDNVTDINVSADGTYIPVLHRTDDRAQPESNNMAEEAHSDEEMIVLDSDEESDQPHSSSNNKINSSQKSSNKTPTTTSRWDQKKSAQPKSNIQSQSVPKVSENSNLSKSVNTSKSIQIHLSNPSVPVANKSNEGISQNIPRLRSISANIPKTVSGAVINAPHILGDPNSLFSVPPPLYAPNSIYGSPNIQLMPPTNTIQSCNQSNHVLSAPIQGPLYASNIVPSTINQSVNQKIFQISSLIQSTMPITNVTLSQSSMLTSTFTEVIQAPAHIPIVPTIHISSIHEPIPAPKNISIPTLISRPISSVVSAPIKDLTQGVNQMSVVAPVSTSSFEQIQTQLLSKPIQEPIKTPTIRTVSTTPNINLTATLTEPILTLANALNSQNFPSQVISSISDTISTTPLAHIASSFNLTSIPSSTISDKAVTNNAMASLNNSLNKSYLTIDRTINDVVKTLPTNVVCPIEPPIMNKNIIGRPISCPVMILDPNTSTSLLPEIIAAPAQSLPILAESTHMESSFNEPQQENIPIISTVLEETSAIISKPNTNCPEKGSKRDHENMEVDADKSNLNKKTKQATVPTAHITIPELSIDLTSDDDEIPPIVKSNNVAVSRTPMSGGNIKWCSLLDPNNRASIMSNGVGTKLSKPLSETRGISQTTVNVNSFAHFKPGAINRLIPNRSTTVPQVKRSIDLTVDDDEVQAISTGKKSRVGTYLDSSNLGPI